MNDALPMDVPDDRHPMWKRPTAKQVRTMPPWRSAVLTTLANNLTRFDGRRDCDRILAFCMRTHQWATRARDEDEFLQLLTQTRVAYVRTALEVVTQAKAEAKADDAAKKASAANRLRNQMAVNVIRDLHERILRAVEGCDYRSTN